MKIVAFPFIDMYQSPIGKLVIKATQHHIHQIYFDDDFTGPVNKSAITKQATHQLTEYFNGKLQHFDLPIKQEGTEFMQNVWIKLTQINYGQTISYLTLAEQMGNINMVRAVANANGKNQLAIVVPCHRVIGTNGKLTGYAWGLNRKSWLIDFEQKISGKKLSLF